MKSWNLLISWCFHTSNSLISKSVGFFSFSFFFFWLDAWNKICSKNVLRHKIYHHQCSSGESLHVFKTAAQPHSFFLNFILILVNILNWTLEGPIVKSNANQTWLIWCSWSWAGASMIPVMVPTLVTGRLYLQIIPELQLNSSRLISFCFFFKCFLIM